jgi:ribose-phosphate pyrophosphokinase
MSQQRQHIRWKTSTEFPYILNLDIDFSPYKDGVGLSHTKFNFKGGEPHLQIVSPCEYAGQSHLVITQRYNKVGDLFDIILANDAARRMGFKNIKLILPYFPAARQDRVCNEGEPLTIKVFTDMINSCGFDEVVILCPHSEVTSALINNVTVLDELEYVKHTVNSYQLGDEVIINIVCPDAGAGKRVNKIVQYLSNNVMDCKFNLVRCEKVRDVKDGSIKEFFVDVDDLHGEACLICDDITSLGGTFIGLGKKLKEKNCGKLMLFTTHNDCVEGLDNMVNFFDHFFTTNSKKNWGQLCYLTGKVTCFDIKL